MTGWLGLLARGGVLQDAGAAGRAVASFVVGEERVEELAAWFEAQDVEGARRERRAAVELCIWMAHADRDVSPEERLLLRQLVARSGLDADTQDELVHAVHHPAPIDRVEQRLTHPVLRELMLALAWELAMADGRIDGAELELYASLAGRFGIAPERATEIRDALGAEVV
jgi:tellurite resistance protein